MQKLWRGIKWTLGAGALIGFGFVGLAGISATFPTSGRAQIPAEGPPIFVCAGAIHTDFAVPAALARSEAYGPVANFIPASTPHDTYVLMGWGDYRFFTEVQTLRQLRLSIALNALTGRNDTALRIVFTTKDSLRDFCRPLPLDKAGQDALARHIQATVSQPLRVMPTIAHGIIYLKANQRYGVLHTCNDWTSAGLRKAGLPTARFHAPFAFSVTWSLRNLPSH